MGAVFSHTKGFTTVGEMLPALVFHTVCCLLGAWLMGKSAPAKAAAKA